jgi:polysaccharide pyruvyl transferase WcaK-like protein
MKIVIAACGYGAGNIGDEAILSGLINILLSIDSSINIHAMSINPKITKKMHHIESFIWMNFKKPISILKYILNIQSCDLVLFGGATLGDDTYGISYPIVSTSIMIFFAKLFRKKTGLISIGVNKFETTLGKIFVRLFYGSVDFITTRDRPSLMILNSIGINKNKIVETADAAYALNPLKKNIGLSALKLRGIDDSKKLVAISVLNEVYQHYDYKEKIAQLCDYLIERYDYVPVFINHEVRLGKDQEATNDTISYIKEKYKVKIFSIEFYPPDLMASMLMNFQFAIGMRMHFLILSTIAQIPVIGISRVDKVDNFFQQLGLDTFSHIKNLEIDKLFKCIDNIIVNRGYYVEKAKMFSRQKKSDISKSIYILKDYINK